MTPLSRERSGKNSAESSREFIFSSPRELARAALTYATGESDDVSYLEIEETLASLTSEAHEMIQRRGRPSRRTRRSLSRYAHHLLTIIEDEPDLLNPRSISLVAHAADATGERKLLEDTLEQAQRAHLSSDTDENLHAIQTALELDLPFAEAMRALNDLVVPFSEEPITDHIPLGSDYDFLFDRTVTRPLASRRQSELPVDDSGTPTTVEEAVHGIKKRP